MSSPTKDVMRKFWKITGHHLPDGRLLSSALEQDGHVNLEQVLGTIDDAFMGNLRYRIASMEIGDENGKVHFHAYIETERAVRLSTVWKRLDSLQCQTRPKPKSQPRYAARDYAYKPLDKTHLAGPFELGHFTAPRPDEKSSPLDDCVQMVLDGYSLRDVARMYPRTFVIYGKRLEYFANILTTDRLKLFGHHTGHTSRDYQQ